MAALSFLEPSMRYITLHFSNSNVLIISKTHFCVILDGPWPPPRGYSERMMEFSNFRQDARGGFTPGNPNVTSFVWTGPQNFTLNGSILDIQNITRSQRGRYTLTASNFLQPTNKPPMWAEAHYFVYLDVYCKYLKLYLKFYCSVCRYGVA